MYICFCFKDTATTEVETYWHTLSLHDALPISDPASLTAGFDQPRRVGGSGSGVRSLPRRTVVVGQKARDGSAARAASAGASLRTAMGTTQPLAALQARVMPLQGFCAGCCRSAERRGGAGWVKTWRSRVGAGY